MCRYATHSLTLSQLDRRTAALLRQIYITHLLTRLGLLTYLPSYWNKVGSTSEWGKWSKSNLSVLTMQLNLPYSVHQLSTIQCNQMTSILQWWKQDQNFKTKTNIDQSPSETGLVIRPVSDFVPTWGRGGSRILQGRVSNPSERGTRGRAPKAPREVARGVWRAGYAPSRIFFCISYTKWWLFMQFPVVLASLYSISKKGTVIKRAGVRTSWTPPAPGSALAIVQIVEAVLTTVRGSWAKPLWSWTRTILAFGRSMKATT